MANVAQIPKSLFMHIYIFSISVRTLFSVSGGTYTLLLTGNLWRKCRRGRIQYIKHFSENTILLHHLKIEYSHMEDSYDTVLYKGSQRSAVLMILKTKFPWILHSTYRHVLSTPEKISNS